MPTPDSWQTAEIGGTRQAVVIQKPETADAILQKATRPLIIIGHQAIMTEAGDHSALDYLIGFVKARNIMVIATGHANRDIAARGVTGATILPAVEVGQRICDPTWTGPDGKGPVDLVLVAGLPYPMAWTLLSGLRHFAPMVKTISLDPMYQPNATLSFGNISWSAWAGAMTVLARSKELEE